MNIDLEKKTATPSNRKKKKKSQVEWSKCFCPPAGCQAQDAIWCLRFFRRPKTPSSTHILAGHVESNMWQNRFKMSSFWWHVLLESLYMVVKRSATWCESEMVNPFAIWSQGRVNDTSYNRMGFGWMLVSPVCASVKINVLIPSRQLQQLGLYEFIKLIILNC